MDTPLLILLAFALGAGTALGGAALVARVLRPRIEQAEAAAREATDRLVMAWREGAVIPEAPQGDPQQPEELHPDVSAWLDQWDATGRPVWEARVRALMAEGYQAPAIIRRLEEPLS